jgi:HAD superfamily hydrolase (TIGR01484 family)
VFFVALAIDYDGTLARNGRVDPAAIEALKEVKSSGRKLVLVTGRELSELTSLFTELELFDLVVAENGGLLFNPANKEETPLAEAPSAALVERLRELGVSPLSIGRTILATWEPNETAVLRAIRELGLGLHIIFNKGAVMVLPSEVSKASGLSQALKRLRLSPHNVVGIGDAQNDQGFLSACGCAVAVANALPSIKATVDFIVADHSDGVIELARMLIESDLSSAKVRVATVQPVLGERADKTPLRLSPFETVLITGSSGGGKSTIVTGLLEQMRESVLQFCVVDPEGDYTELRDAVVMGDAKQEPQLSEAMDLLSKPEVNVVVNLVAIDPAERPRFLANFLPETAKLRSETGRPHWIVLDEVHHCLPAKWDPAPVTLPRELPAAIAVTVHPEEVSRDFLSLVSTVVGVGAGAAQTISNFCEATGRCCLDRPVGLLEPDQVQVLRRDGNMEVIAVTRPKERQKRHVRKYAEGELGEDKSFFFRGPEGELNLRAQNLSVFLQLAAGVDDNTWLHHLRAGEYSKWFREAIKDEDLGAEASVIETDESLSARDSRSRIREMVERRYTAPAKSGG